jgi:nucleoside 2-deoxyribosyltransferase
MIKSLYVVGSLRNDNIHKVAQEIRLKTNFEVFDDWYAAGPEADDYWRTYELNRGRNYEEALAGRAATNTFRYDKSNLDRCDACVLVLPAGKSGHLELGYFIGCGKPGYILLDSDYDRWDVMYRFATKVVRTTDQLISELLS